ncbi:MAG: hypothetical protein LC632_09270 [Xanthomonadaceae bacterium]|nr:hypothetical protein [Xanthomonadaceae bacterium]
MKELGDRIYRVLLVLCVLSVIADLFYEKHAYFWWENLIGFHAMYGFVACVALVLVAKQLRKLLMRPEDYYDR